MEGKAQVSLHHNPPGSQPLFYARYLAEVPADDPISARYSAPKDRQTESYLTWVDHVFFPSDVPSLSSFSWPIALLLKDVPTTASNSSTRRVKLPMSLPLESATDWSDLESGEGLIAYDLIEMCRDPHHFPLAKGSSSRPVVVVEQNDYGLYRAHTDSQGKAVVDVWVHRDSSYFRLESNFLHHFRADGDKVYHIDVVKHLRVQLEDGSR